MKVEDHVVSNVRTYREPDEKELRREHLRLLRFSAYWCKRCKLDAATCSHEFLNEAVADLYSGNCPSDCEQVAYLKTRIQQLACNTVSKAKKQSEITKREVHSTADLADSLAQRETDSEKHTTNNELAQQVLAALSHMAAEKNDDEVELMLMAYDEGFEKRGDVLEATGLTSDQYGAAKKRLATMINRLPRPLLVNVCETLGGHHE